MKYIGDDIRLECWDSSATGDALVGCATLKSSAFTVNGGFDEWVSLEYKGKQAGQLHLQSAYDKDALAKAQKEAEAERSNPAPINVVVNTQGPQINMNNSMQMQ